VNIPEVKGSATARRRQLLGAFVCVALAVVAFVWIALKPKGGSGPPVPSGNLQANVDGPEAIAQRPAEQPAIPQEPAPAEERESIETGHYFHMGRYVPPPYKVTIVDFKVLINGEYVIDSYGKPKRPKVGVPEDPGEFEWTEAKLKQRFSATGFVEHAGAKFRYWVFKHGYGRAMEMKIQYYRNQSTVKSVEAYKDGSMRIRGIHGCVFGVNSGTEGSFLEAMKERYAPTEAEAERYHKQAIARAMASLEVSRRCEEGILKIGAVVFNLSPDGGVTSSFAPGSAHVRLQRIGRILRSARSQEEKIEAIMAIEPNKEFAALIVENWGGVWPEVKAE